MPFRPFAKCVIRYRSLIAMPLFTIHKRPLRIKGGTSFKVLGTVCADTTTVQLVRDKLCKL